MSLANYSDLNTAVANWTGRSDLTSRIPEGITLAEAKINRLLRTKDMETKTTFSITGEYVALPSNFGGVREFYLNTTPRVILQPASPDLLTTNYSTGTDQPLYYAIEGANFRFGPIPDATYSATLLYYLQVPALTNSNTTNWLMTAYPDVYLYGVNAEMEAFAKNWDAAAQWSQKMYAALNEAMVISNKDKFSGGSIAQRPG